LEGVVGVHMIMALTIENEDDQQKMTTPNSCHLV